MFAILLCFRAGKPPPGLHLDVMKGDKLIEVTHWQKCYVFYIDSEWIHESTRYSLVVNFPDVLHTGILYGCMASNGARLASSQRFKLFSGRQNCWVMTLGHRFTAQCLLNISSVSASTIYWNSLCRNWS